MRWRRMRLNRALGYIALSTLPLLITIAVVFCFKFSSPPNLTIEGIKLKSNVSLQPHYLEELLGLSQDHPTRFDECDLQMATKILEKTAQFEMVQLSFQKPNLLSIKLEARIPIAVLGDYSNTGIDQEGILFPLSPIHLNPSLPTICLGEECPQGVWGENIPKHIVDYLNRYPNVVMWDWSNSKNPSLGLRYVCVETNEGDLLRLHPQKIDEALSNYSKFRARVESKSYILDFRLPKVAYVKERHH